MSRPLETFSSTSLEFKNIQQQKRKGKHLSVESKYRGIKARRVLSDEANCNFISVFSSFGAVGGKPISAALCSITLKLGKLWKLFQNFFCCHSWAINMITTRRARAAKISHAVKSASLIVYICSRMQRTLRNARMSVEGELLIDSILRAIWLFFKRTIKFSRALGKYFLCEQFFIISLRAISNPDFSTMTVHAWTLTWFWHDVFGLAGKKTFDFALSQQVWDARRGAEAKSHKRRTSTDTTINTWRNSPFAVVPLRSTKRDDKRVARMPFARNGEIAWKWQLGVRAFFPLISFRESFLDFCFSRHRPTIAIGRRERGDRTLFGARSVRWAVVWVYQGGSGGGKVSQGLGDYLLVR